jgi:hypothetical protein
MTFPFSSRASPMASRLFYCFIDKSTGVDDDKICPLVAATDLIALRPELGQNSFRINKCFRTAKRNKSNGRGSHARD